MCISNTPTYVFEREREYQPIYIAKNFPGTLQSEMDRKKKVVVILAISKVQSDVQLCSTCTIAKLEM